VHAVDEVRGRATPAEPMPPQSMECNARGAGVMAVGLIEHGSISLVSIDSGSMEVLLYARIVTQPSGKARRPSHHTTLRKGRAKRAKEPRSRVRLDVDARRAQLVDLGLTEFGTRTYDEVSIDRIAQMAGISKGLLYHYFPTKRAFYVACVREA